MPRRVVALTLVMCLVVAVPAWGDVVVLKNGKRYEGTLADRDEVRRDSHRRLKLAILLSGSEELVRFEAADVDHVIIEDGDSSYVLDFQSRESRLLGSSASAPAAERPNGIPLIIGGFLVGGVGAFAKFGEEELRVTADSVELKPSYNAFNYTMIVGGAGMVVIGIAMEVSRRQYESHEGSRASFGSRLSPIDGVPSVAIGWGF